ncbi:Crp/Fnr family transcriptional regulator [Novosphingopyxis sp.]|uniref:Crp/Fnr family transcriptional regulator n=1 Tax=Novosphingopyxis sp. TaxID=2709690 RepID=UPI003B5C3786
MIGMLSDENWIRDLPYHVQQAIEERMSTVEIAAGSVFKHAGGAADGLYQVEEGYLRLLGLHSDGRQILILIYRKGNTFGETPMVAGRPFNHTTVALTEVRIKKVAQSDFWDLYHKHPDIPEALCRKFAWNISRNFENRELRSTRRLSGQIVATMANVAKFCGKPEPDGAISIALPITQIDIAEHLEVTRQAVQREMAKLKKTRLIEKRSGTWYCQRAEVLLSAIEPD